MRGKTMRVEKDVAGARGKKRTRGTQRGQRGDGPRKKEFGTCATIASEIRVRGLKKKANGAKKWPVMCSKRVMVGNIGKLNKRLTDIKARKKDRRQTK